MSSRKVVMGEKRVIVGKMKYVVKERRVIERIGMVGGRRVML